MAATDASIAVAFIRDGGLWIEMLAPDLSPLTEANRIASSNAADLDLIAAPSGWLLVARSESIDLYSLNASGGLLSTSVVTSGLAMPPLWLNGTTTRGIKVVPRSAGGVFVLWQTPDSDGSSHGLYAVALSANASAIAAPTRLETLGDPNFTATATPDGMLIAGRVMDVSGNRELVTFQVSASGALVGQPRSVDPFGDSPALAPTNDGGVVLAYQRFDPPATAQWVKLDATGEPQVGPIAVDPSELPIGATPISIVPMNADFVVVTPSGPGSVGNSFLRISEVGAVTAPLVPFLMDPRVAAVRAARCGSEIIVVSQSFDAGVLSFSFARVAP